MLIHDFPEDSATGAQIKSYMAAQNGLDSLPWLMSGTVPLATEFIEVVGEDPNRVGSLGRVPLHWAVLCCCLDVVIYLMTKGADKDLEDKFGNTPWTLALASENQDIIDALSGE